MADAAMLTINEWPSNGDGRAVKAGCERIATLLDNTVRVRLVTALSGFEEVVQEFRAIEDNPFFKERLSSRKLRGADWPNQELGHVLATAIEKTSAVLNEHGPRLRQEAEEQARTASSEEAADNLRQITPPQKVGPIQFEVVGGRLQIAPQSAEAERDRTAGAEQAREQLFADASWIVENFQQSNVDQRVVEIVEDIRAQLSKRRNVIRIGVANGACEQIAESLAEEVAAPLTAKLTAFTVGVRLYVSQFPEWHYFVDAASERDVTLRDASDALKVGARLVTELSRRSDLADPEVPRSIKIMLEAINQPQKAGRRAVFAVVRTIENLVSKIFSEFGATLLAGSEGVREGVKKAVAITATVGLLTIAATAAHDIAPAAKSVLKTDWLKKAADIVEKGLDDLK